MGHLHLWKKSPSICVMTLVPVPVNVTPTLNMAEPQNISKCLRMSKNWFLNMFGISALERDTNMIFSWTGWRMDRCPKVCFIPGSADEVRHVIRSLPENFNTRDTQSGIPYTSTRSHSSHLKDFKRPCCVKVWSQSSSKSMVVLPIHTVMIFTTQEIFT